MVTGIMIFQVRCPQNNLMCNTFTKLCSLLASDGLGVMQYPTGDKYEGNWKAGLRSGFVCKITIFIILYAISAKTIADKLGSHVLFER